MQQCDVFTKNHPNWLNAFPFVDKKFEKSGLLLRTKKKGFFAHLTCECVYLRDIRS